MPASTEAITHLRLPAVVTHARANACAKALREALRLSKGADWVQVDASALQQFDSSALAERNKAGSGGAAAARKG